MTEPIKHPVVYVDLIEDKPKTREEFIEWLGLNVDAVHAPTITSMIDSDYRKYLDGFQPFRWRSKSEGNNEVLGQGERYFNEADAERNIRLQFGGDTMVYLRRAEHGNELLRSAYPSPWGDTIVIGPECFAATDGSVLNWRGVNYVPQQES